MQYQNKVSTGSTSFKKKLEDCNPKEFPSQGPDPNFHNPWNHMGTFLIIIYHRNSIVNMGYNSVVCEFE